MPVQKISSLGHGSVFPAIVNSVVPVCFVQVLSAVEKPPNESGGTVGASIAKIVLFFEQNRSLRGTGSYNPVGRPGGTAKTAMRLGGE